MPDLRYAKTHEWVSVSDAGGAKVATIGVSAFAVEQLTDLVYMQLKAPGLKLKVGDVFGEIESVKAVSDLYSPVEGEIVEVNSALPNNLETLNKDPYNAGWIIKVKLAPTAKLDHLMDAAAYKKQCDASH
jgi:glycine cleavage system H protein